MNEKDSDVQNGITRCKLIYNVILIGALMLPLVMYAVYLPMRSDSVLLWGIPLLCITFFIISGMQKNPCENAEGGNREDEIERGN